jgi:hypothetical protein
MFNEWSSRPVDALLRFGVTLRPVAVPFFLELPNEGQRGKTGSAHKTTGVVALMPRTTVHHCGSNNLQLLSGVHA